MTITAENFFRGLVVSCWLLFAWHGCQIEAVKNNIEAVRSNQYFQEKRFSSMFYEFSDSCTWLDLTREQLIEIGIPPVRRSDNRPVEVMHLYACMNFKDAK